MTNTLILKIKFNGWRLYNVNVILTINVLAPTQYLKKLIDSMKTNKTIIYKVIYPLKAMMNMIKCFKICIEYIKKLIGV